MACVIIRKKDLDKFGKKLMKEVYHHIHDDYMLTFDEVKSERDYVDKNLVNKFLIFYRKKENNLCLLDFKKSYEELATITPEGLLKEIEDKIEDETLDVEIIFEVLKDLKLDSELNEDLYYSKKAFINIYKVYDYEHTYLED